MKYHHKSGIIEKDKKDHPKIWVTFFIFFALVGYSGFLYATVALNGWPVSAPDQTARVVKTTKPGGSGDYLFIPAINVSAPVGSVIEQVGIPGEDKVALQGKTLALGATVDAVRTASPFYNLSLLKDDDEVFLDHEEVRFAYRVAKKSTHEKRLILTSGDKKVIAEPVGKVAWDNGSGKLEAL